MFACSYVRVFVQNPGIAPGSGFKPPYYRLQRNEDNRGLRPQDFFVPFFRKKVPKNSPTDAYTYNGSGIESESLAANGGAGVRRLFYEYLRRTESESQ